MSSQIVIIVTQGYTIDKDEIFLIPGFFLDTLQFCLNELNPFCFQG